MSVIVRKCIVTLSNHFSSLSALFFSSSSSISNPILLCLNQTGFSTPQIDEMIKKHPPILKVSPEILKSKLNIFHDKGFSTLDTIDIISRHPKILNRCSEDCIKTLIASLKFVLGSTEAVCRVLKKTSWFLSSNLDKTMIPNFEYLMNRSGLSCSSVANHMINYPRTLLLRPETVAEGVKRVDEMGLDWSPKMYLCAVGVVCSLSPETFKLKKDIFLGLGFSHHNVLMMFNRFPKLFSCSEKNIKKTMEVLLSSGRTNLSSLAVEHTTVLLYSVEKRIKPRIKVVEALEERGLLPRKLGLSRIVNMTNKKFLENLVLSILDALGNNIRKQAGKVSPEILKAKLRIFHDNGFSTLNTIDIISRHPYILNQCLESRIKTSIASLKFVLGSTEAVCKVLKKLYRFPSYLDKTMITNFEYWMNHSGLSCSEVKDHMILTPRTFLCRPKALTEGARRVDEMRLHWSPKMYLYAVDVMCSLSPETFELKKNMFFEFGFSDCEVLRIFNRYPKVFSYSEKKIKNTMEVLLSSGRIDRPSLASKNTGLLLLSLEKRIKPRLEVLKVLEERSLLLKKLSLLSVLHMSNKKFLEKLVLSNSKELGNDFVSSITNKMGGKSCRI